MAASHLAACSGRGCSRSSVLPATWAVKSLALDGTEITDVVTQFGAGDCLTLRVVVTPRAASVRGRVEDSDGALAGARVVVFSNDERHWRPRSRLRACH